MLKKLSQEQFQNRLTEMLKARQMFMPHITNNITTAWELYQKIVAEEEMSIFITNAQVEHLKQNPLKDLQRPKCPECGEDMVLKIGAVDMNGKQWATAWACKPCMIEIYSEDSVETWRKKLIDVKRLPEK